DLPICFANHEPVCLFDLGINPGDLVEPNPESELRHVTVFNINRGADNPHVTSLKLRQIMGSQGIRLVPFLVQIHRQIEREINYAVGMEPLNSLINRFVRQFAHFYGEGGGGATVGRSTSSFALGANKQSRASNQTEPSVRTPGNQIFQRDIKT